MLDENGEPIEKVTPEAKEPLFSKKHWWIWVCPIVLLIVAIIIVVAASKPREQVSPEEPFVPAPPPNTFSESDEYVEPLQCDDDHVLVQNGD